MNDIISLLNLEDSDIEIESVEKIGTTKTVTLFTRPKPHYCPKCGYLMHSRGVKVRTINHPVLQDSYHMILKLKQRRWRCTNQNCRFDEAEEFNFINKNCRNTKSTDLMILNEFRSLTATSADIARRYNTSDTYVHSVFNRFVHMKRLPLTQAVSVDEVYINMSDNCKYALVIQDFITGEAIDLLESRKQDVTQPYFMNIPVEERNKVEYLISDMHNDYISFVDKYFHNAIPVVDSFHVIQWIRFELEQFIRALQKSFENRDEERQKNAPYDGFGRQVKYPESDEVYLLKNYRFFLLSNGDDIERYETSHMDKHFKYFMNTAEYERRFFEVDPRLSTLKYLKDKYVSFNDRNAGKPQKAAIEIDELIEEYKRSGDEIFMRFARTLKRFRQPIINSFILIERLAANGETSVSRLSNGPMESMNRQIKDLRRVAHGFRSFEHLRNRFLFAKRKDPVLNGTIDTSEITEKPLRFSGSVHKEAQRRLLEEYEVLKEKFPDMTDDEKLELRHWISMGNSPFKNPDEMYDENGLVADFITASRLIDDALNG